MSDSVQPHKPLLPGSSVPGILQAITLEWVAISFSNAWKWKVKEKSLSCVQLLVTSGTAAYQAPLSMGNDPAIPILGIYPEKNMIWKDTCTPVFTVALFNNSQNIEVT